MTLPGNREPPEALALQRESTWRELGSAERSLLDHIHRLAAEHPHSAGVILSTETPANLSLYEHFGYRQIGSAKVSAELETWAFYRPNPGAKW